MSGFIEIKVLSKQLQGSHKNCEKQRLCLRQNFSTIKWSGREVKQTWLILKSKDLEKRVSVLRNFVTMPRKVMQLIHQAAFYWSVHSFVPLFVWNQKCDQVLTEWLLVTLLVSAEQHYWPILISKCSLNWNLFSSKALYTKLNWKHCIWVSIVRPWCLQVPCPVFQYSCNEPHSRFVAGCPTLWFSLYLV